MPERSDGLVLEIESARGILQSLRSFRMTKKVRPTESERRFARKAIFELDPEHPHKLLRQER